MIFEKLVVDNTFIQKYINIQDYNSIPMEWETPKKFMHMYVLVLIGKIDWKTEEKLTVFNIIKSCILFFNKTSITISEKW